MSFTPMYTGQTDPPALWTLLDDTKKPVNLTGYTMIAILIAEQRNPANTRTGGIPTITDAVNGVVTYQWLDSDTSQAGFFFVYIRATNNSTSKTRFWDPGPWQVIQT